MRARFAALILALAVVLGGAVTVAPAAHAGSYLRYMCYWGGIGWYDHDYNTWLNLKRSGMYCVARY